jgi:penicillin-binding protein 1A
MGRSATGGQVSAPIFANFMKMALKDKKAVPFRQPPGIKMVRINPKTGLRAGSGDREAIWEAYKPFEEPDDPNSFLGYEAMTSEADPNQSYPGQAPRNVSVGRGGLY